jgi:hypothetical protein
MFDSRSEIESHTDKNKLDFWDMLIKWKFNTCSIILFIINYANKLQKKC